MRLVRFLGGRTFASVRRHRNYRLFFFGQIVSVTGTWMQNIAMYWLVVTLTESALAVAFLSVARFGPLTLFTLFAGTAADRLDNRRTVMFTQATQLVLAVALAALALTGTVAAWHVYVLAFLGGVVISLDAPARHTMTFQLVGRDELPNAVALNATLFNAGRLVGPAIAGVMIGVAGVGWCFAVNAASFLAVLTGLALMRVDELVPVERSGDGSIWRGTREGLGYARRSPRMVAILATTMVFGSLLFNVHALLPILAKDTLDSGAGVFGLITATFGGGALVGALATAAFGRGSWRVAAVAATAYALCELAIAPLRSTLLVAALLFFAGISFTVFAASAQTAVQLLAPDYLRGRLVSLYLYAWAGLVPVGAVVIGWLCDVGGTGLAFTVLGVTGLVTVAASSWHLLHARGRTVAMMPSRAR